MKAYLRLPMNKDINVKLFLKFDNFVNFLLDGLDILFLRDPKKKKNIHQQLL